MPDLDAEDVPQEQCDSQARQTADKREKVVLLPCADHSLEELTPIKNADSVKEHDQARQADRPDDLGFGCECAEGETDKKNGADAEREAEDVDLTNQVTHAYRQEGRQDGLASDDVASKVQHVRSPQMSCRSARADSRRPGTAR